MKSNDSALTFVEVAFKEVDAVYDLPGALRLVGSPTRPKVVMDNRRFAPLLAGTYGFPKFTDENGDEVDDVNDDVPGVYQGVRVEGYAPFLRTFARKRAGDLDDKYVYVFSADDKAGATNVRLVQELYFKKGEFQIVDLSANAGQDVRKPAEKAAKHPKLQLPIFRIAGGQKTALSWFFLLAPYQIPWERLQKLGGDGARIAGRASRLFDEMWTDAFTDGDVSKVKTLFELTHGSKPDKLGFLVYLVDPFKEALVRCARHGAARDKWQDELRSLGKDDTYLLGKRIDAFTARASELSELVQPRLGSYLQDKEQKSARLCVAAEAAAESLLRWVAYGQKLDRCGPSDTYYNDGKSTWAYKEEKPQPDFGNAFSDAVRDYLEAPDETAEASLHIVDLVQSEISESSTGEIWMNDVFQSLVDKQFPAGTAGAELLFEASRKKNAFLSEGWAHLFKHWSKHWTMKYGEEATANLKAWLKARDVDLALYTPREVRRAIKAQEKRNLKKARKAVFKDDEEKLRIWIDSPKTKAGKLSKGALEHFMVGLELYNLFLSIEKARTEPNTWTRLGVLGSACDAYSAAAKAWESVDEMALKFSYKGASKAIKIAPFVGMVSSAIDCATFGHELLEARGMDEKVGHAVRFSGGVFSLIASGGEAAEAIGVATSESGAGVILAVAGLALEAAGAWFVANVTSAAKFLRHCKWGDGGGLGARAVDAVDGGNNFGFKGKLSELAGDVGAQNRALDEIVYDFRPELELSKKGDEAELTLKVGTSTEADKNPFCSRAKWSIKIEAKHDFSVMPDTFEFHPDDDLDDIGVTANEEIPLKTYKKGASSPWDDAKGKLHVKGTVKVDAFGDGTHVIERELDESRHLSWF